MMVKNPLFPDGFLGGATLFRVVKDVMGNSAAAAAESSPNSEDDESLNDANLQQVEIFALYTAICHCHCLILKCSIAL